MDMHPSQSAQLLQRELVHAIHRHIYILQRVDNLIIYIYIYIYMYIYIHRIYAHICTHKHTHTHTHILYRVGKMLQKCKDNVKGMATATAAAACVSVTMVCMLKTYMHTV
jgi:hypothetical protein